MRHYWNRERYQLTREQLYDLVWSEAMWRLCKHFKITDVALAKHCRKIGVPLPKRGYWNKLQASHKVTRTPLPERDLATVNVITMYGTFPPELRERIKGEPGVTDAADDDVELLAARFRRRLGKVPVPRDFTDAHPVIAALLKKDEEYRQAMLVDRYAWRKPLFDAPFEQRRLRLLNALFLAFARMGGSPWARGDNARELGVHIGSSGVRFELDKLPRAAGRRRGAEPTAETKEKLGLTMSEIPGVTTRWEDGDGLPLERQLAEVMVGMLVAGEHGHRRCLERQAAWEREQREAEELAAIKRREEAERRERERRSRKPRWTRFSTTPRPGARPITFGSTFRRCRTLPANGSTRPNSRRGAAGHQTKPTGSIRSVRGWLGTGWQAPAARMKSESR